MKRRSFMQFWMPDSWLTWDSRPHGQPFVIPTLYGREGDKLYLHGSSASRMLGELETGVPACVNVTLVDGLVLARSAFHHSMNYRSVVAFGTARKIEEPEQKVR